MFINFSNSQQFIRTKEGKRSDPKTNKTRKTRKKQKSENLGADKYKN